VPSQTESRGRSYTNQISNDAVLSVFRQEVCLDIGKLAGRLHLDSSDTTLITIIDSLMRAGKLRRIGGKGRHSLFVLSTFEA